MSAGAGAAFARGLKRFLGTPFRMIPKPLLYAGGAAAGVGAVGAGGYGLYRNLDNRATQLRHNAPTVQANRRRADTLDYGAGSTFNPPGYA